MIKNTIVLAGAPCSGKSSVGRILSDLLHAEFLDTDTLVESKSKHTIRWIFQNRGEKTFRKLEHEILAGIFRNNHGITVVALGGGTLLDPVNFSLVNEKAIVFTLFATTDTLVARNNDVRPLAADSKMFRELMERRKIHYLSLGNRIDTEHKNPVEVAAAIEKAVLPLLFP